MNISEANATATLIDYVCGLPSPLGPPVAPEDALLAVQLLVGRVRKALLAGPTVEAVSAAGVLVVDVDGARVGPPVEDGPLVKALGGRL